MSEPIIQNSFYEDLNQEVIFEITENIRVTKQVKYSKQDMVSSLMTEINKLKQQLEKIEQKNNLIQEESLTKLWDNEHDERWNNC